MTNTLARYGSLAVAAGLLIAGAFSTSTPEGATLFFTAGLIAFGCWLTLEVHFLLGGNSQHGDIVTHDSEETDDE